MKVMTIIVNVAFDSIHSERMYTVLVSSETELGSEKIRPDSNCFLGPNSVSFDINAMKGVGIENSGLKVLTHQHIFAASIFKKNQGSVMAKTQHKIALAILVVFFSS